MLFVSKFWMPEVTGSGNPTSPAFWFIMSIALLGGFIVAYPMNWWLVTNHLKAWHDDHSEMNMPERGTFKAIKIYQQR